MTPTLREFGERVDGANYVLRPGGYAIIRRATGEIAVVATPGGWHLPGGGQNPNETAEQAVIREVREECAWQIRIGASIGVADELVYSRDEATYFRKRCSFFLAELVGQDLGGGEVDHVVSWLTPEQAALRLSHESQRWAVCLVAVND